MIKKQIEPVPPVVCVTIRTIILTILLSIVPASASVKSLCDTGNELTAVRGNGLCLVIETFNADPKRDFKPTLVVMLHGDLSKGGPATYHISIMLWLAKENE